MDALSQASSPTASDQDQRLFVVKPFEQFAVDADHDVFGHSNIFFTTTCKIVQVAWDIFSTIVFPIGLLRLFFDWMDALVVTNAILPAITIYNRNKDAIEQLRRDMFLKNDCLSNVKITTIDDVTLDGCVIYNPGQKDTPPKDQKWVVYAGGNGEFYECNRELARISNDLDANVVQVNYRGVGASEGFPTCAKDLYLDTAASIEYVLSKGVKPENIVLIGHSIGGSFGTVAVSKYHEKGQNINFVNERSFSYFSNEVDVVADMIVDNNLQDHCFYRYLLRCAQAFASILLPIRGWNINPADHIDKLNPDHITVVYNKDDTVIPHPQASFAHVIQTNYASNGFHLMEVTELFSAHNSSLSENDDFYDDYLKRLKAQLAIV